MAWRQCVCLTLFSSGSVLGQQWTAIVLHPPTASRSEVTGVTAIRQGGSFAGPGDDQAGYWSGSAASWTPLSPLGSYGFVYGMDQSRHVGDQQGAALWQGTQQSYLSLHPAGAFASVARAIRAEMQVGTAIFNSNHAALWRGTSASFVDLHPAGAVRSFGRATDGVFQGGYSDWPNSHATIWNGTAQSFVDLNPMANGNSRIYGMALGVQVGVLEISGGEHAALWRGTVQSFVDLNPPGSNLTILFATTGRFHVGQAVLGGAGLARAAINFGSPTAWLDLHQFLPPQYTSFSGANAVYQDGPTIYVGGYAENANNRNAILWVGTTPCYANCDGSSGTPRLTANDFMCFINTFANQDPAANCDQSTGVPSFTANDFQCFINRFAAGCTS